MRNDARCQIVFEFQILIETVNCTVNRVIIEGHFVHEISANPFSYFSTQPSAPHTLKMSIALFRFG